MSIDVVSCLARGAENHREASVRNNLQFRCAPTYDVFRKCDKCVCVCVGGEGGGSQVNVTMMLCGICGPVYILYSCLNGVLIRSG